MMLYKIGEKVSFLYEKGGGIIRKIDDQKMYWIEDETSFERPFKIEEIAKIHKENYDLDQFDDSYIAEDESLLQQRHFVKHENATGRRKAIEVWEIDLHIEELVESHASMSNHDILQKQMSEFRNFYKKANSKLIRKLIIIHGVGEGVLKSEIRDYLSKSDNVECHDADFREYGKGATEILIHYNV